MPLIHLAVDKSANINLSLSIVRSSVLTFNVDVICELYMKSNQNALQPLY